MARNIVLLNGVVSQDDEDEDELEETAGADAISASIEYCVLIAVVVLPGILCVVWYSIPRDSRDTDEKALLVNDGE